MIGHGLAPQAVIRQGLHRDADLLGDEDDQIIGKAAAMEHLRHCHTGVPQQCQLQRDVKAILILPALKDQIDLHRLEGIRPDEVVPALRECSGAAFVRSEVHVYASGTHLSVHKRPIQSMDGTE